MSAERRTLEETTPAPSVALVAPIAVRPRSADLSALSSGLLAPEAFEEHGDSDVFVCRRADLTSDSVADVNDDAEAVDADADTAVTQAVTLYVYGWENVQPGPLSWAFPSLRAALDAVRTMRNAVRWCIVGGIEWASMDAARAKGAVLIEQAE